MHFEMFFGYLFKSFYQISICIEWSIYLETPIRPILLAHLTWLDFVSLYSYISCAFKLNTTQSQKKSSKEFCFINKREILLLVWSSSYFILIFYWSSLNCWWAIKVWDFEMLYWSFFCKATFSHWIDNHFSNFRKCNATNSVFIFHTIHCHLMGWVVPNSLFCPFEMVCYAPTMIGDQF